LPGEGNYDIAYADVDASGAADVVLRNKDSGAVTVRASDGERTFGEPAIWGDAGFWPDRDLRFADVDGDGDGDLVGRDAGGTIWLARSSGTAFGTPERWVSAVGGRYVPADADGDQQDDLFTHDTSSGAVVVHFAGEGTTDLVESETAATVDAGAEVEVVELNADGMSDIVVRDPSTGVVRVALALDVGWSELTDWGTFSGSAFQVVDMNGDGQGDVVTQDPATGDVRVSTSDGERFAADATWTRMAPGEDLNVIDVDGDEQGDAITVAADGAVRASRSNSEPPTERLPDYVPDPQDEDEPEPAPAPAPSTTIPWAQEPGAPPAHECALGRRTGAIPTARMPLGFAADAEFGVALNGNALAGCDTWVKSAGRAGEAGASVIRVIAYWQRYLTSEDYRKKLDTAVRRASDAGMEVYMSLTGYKSDTSMAFPSGSHLFARPSAADGKFTTTTPQVAQYGEFVEQAVAHFLPMGVKKFSIWNEPNLQDTTWLRVQCGASGILRSTTDLYRALYSVGRASAKRASDGAAEVFFGELAATKQGKRVRDCASGRKVRKDTTTLEYVREVVDAQAGEMETEGVSWHPYQQCASPTNARVLCTVEAGLTGMGKIAQVQATLRSLRARLHRPKRSASDPDKTPGLYLTEFGYYNKPPANQLAYRLRGHTESKGAVWYRKALAHAQSNRAKMFILYQVLHRPSDNVDTGTVLDAGILGHVRGPRADGHGEPERQPLRTYCDGVLAWVKQQRRTGPDWLTGMPLPAGAPYAPVFEFAMPIADRVRYERCERLPGDPVDGAA